MKRLRFILLEPVSAAIGITALIETIFGASAAVAAAVGGVIVSAAASIALSVAASVLNKPKTGSNANRQLNVQDQQSSLTLASRTAIDTRDVTLGNVLRAGTIFFEAVRGPYLYRGFILACHEIDGVTQVRLGNTVLSLDPTTGRANTPPYFDGTTCFLQVSIRNGTAGQQIDKIIAADFPNIGSSFRQQGLATAVVKCYRGSSSTVSDAIWGQQDPNFLFLVRGKKVYDPRDGSQSVSDTSTWKFSNNAALCSATWLADADGGRVDWSSIDLEALKTAANVCDQPVLRKDGTTEKRYCIDGVADTSVDPNTTLNDLITSMIGEYTTVDGKYVIYAGAPRDPVCTLDERSSRGTLDITTERPWQDYINSVSTSFVAKDRAYAVATGPVYQDLTAIASDGTDKSTTLQLPYVTSGTQVQRICKYLIRHSQLGGTIQRGENIEAMRLTASDVVRLEYTGGLASVSGNWQVVRLTEANRIDEYVIQLAEYDGPFLFAWNPAVDERDWSQATLNLK